MAYKIEQERINKTFATEHAAAEMTRLEKETELKRQAVGLDIPETIKNVTTGGLVGKAPKADPALPAEGSLPVK